MSSAEEKPSPQRLASLMAKAGISLDTRQTDQFWRFHRHLRERNEALNMTRIYEFEAMVLKLYIDSAIVGKLTKLPSPLLDIGTGPGFPGIPLAILHPDVQFLLSEGRHKRNEFLQEVVDMLGLKNVEVLGHRIAPDYDRPVNGVITRAVETIDVTLDRVLRCLQPGGRALFMKGPECDDEIALSDRKFERFYRRTDDIRYQLLDTDNYRRLVIYERTEVPAPRPVAGEVIRSADNARVRGWKNALTAKGVKKEGYGLASGKHVLEILELAPEAVVQVIAREGSKAQPEQIGLPTSILTPDLFALLEPAAPNLPVAAVRVPEFAELSGELPERCLVLGVQDPGDLGALVRTAAAFGIDHVVLAKEAAHPFHPRALQTAGAAALRITFYSGPPVAELPANVKGGYRLTGVGQAGQGDKLRLFVGTQATPAWEPTGAFSGEIEPEPAVTLAAVLALTPRPQTKTI